MTYQNELAGIFTDSDRRRLITKHAGEFSRLLNQPIGQFINPKRKTIHIEDLASEALRIFDKQRTSRVFCMDGDKLAGLLS